MNANTYPAAQNVMVLYTGGTIGMQASAHGLAPASGFEARMRDYLHSQPELVVPNWRFREMAPLIDSANMTPPTGSACAKPWSMRSTCRAATAC